MSKFVTSLPVDVDSLIAKLPSGAVVHEIILRPGHQAVDVVWDCDDYRSKVTFPIEWPAGEPTPAGVIFTPRVPVAPAAVPSVSRQTGQEQLPEASGEAQPRVRKKSGRA